MNLTENSFEDSKEKYGYVFERAINSIFKKIPCLVPFENKHVKNGIIKLSQAKMLFDYLYFQFRFVDKFDYFLRERIIKTNSDEFIISCEYKKGWDTYSFRIDKERIIIKNSVFNVKIKNHFFSFNSTDKYLTITDKKFQQIGFFLSEQDEGKFFIDLSKPRFISEEKFDSNFEEHIEFLFKNEASFKDKNLINSTLSKGDNDSERTDNIKEPYKQSKLGSAIRSSSGSHYKSQASFTKKMKLYYKSKTDKDITECKLFQNEKYFSRYEFKDNVDIEVNKYAEYQTDILVKSNDGFEFDFEIFKDFSTDIPMKNKNVFIQKNSIIIAEVKSYFNFFEAKKQLEIRLDILRNIFKIKDPIYGFFIAQGKDHFYNNQHQYLIEKLENKYRCKLFVLVFNESSMADLRSINEETSSKVSFDLIDKRKGYCESNSNNSEERKKFSRSNEDSILRSSRRGEENDEISYTEFRRNFIDKRNSG